MASNSPVSTRLTELTLSEQLKITPSEIRTRKQLLSFTAADISQLLECRLYINAHIDEIVEEFYTFQRRHDEISLLIGDAETLKRLHASMRGYVIDLFQGEYQEEYVNKRLRIGKVHKQIGVSPKLYIAAIAALEQILQQHIENSGLVDYVEATTALHKLIMLDVQLVFDTYINSLLSEVETAKSKAEFYAAGLEDTIAERTQQLERLSRIDNLTELQNQRAFQEHIKREAERAKRHGSSLALAYIDINHFKEINDSLGHQEGDRVLSSLGLAMKQAARSIDICCRQGGDEFAVIMTDTDLGSAKEMLQRFLSLFDPLVDSKVSVSVGIASSSHTNPLDEKSLISLADQAMYRAKERSRTQSGHQIESASSIEKAK